MDDRFNTLLERLAETTDEQLTEFSAILESELQTAAEERNVEYARELKDAIEKVRSECVRREEETAAREAELAEIMASVFQSEDPEGEDDAGGETDPEAEADPSDGEPAEGEDAPADEPEPATTVEAKTRTPLPTLTEFKARQRKRAPATPVRDIPEPATEAKVRVITATDGGGITAGTEMPDAEDRARYMAERFPMLSPGQRIAMFRQITEFPEDRLLRGDDSYGNSRKVRAVNTPQALVASGGICAPLTGWYDAMTFAVAERPIKGALPGFGADRGGIRRILPSSVGDMSGAIGHITEAEDAAGGADGTKPCLTIVCEDITETTINAVSRCLEIGNFNARTHPEYIAHLQELTLAAWARTAESNLWETICDGSTAVTAAEHLSAWRDLYASVGRAVAMFRSRHRMSARAPFRLMAPFWLADMLTIDLTRQFPGDSTIALATSQFETWLRQIGVNVTWTLEGGTDAPTGVFGAQGVGPVDGWPDSVETLLFPEGSWLFLDGGTLDLGLVRDSTLNVTNDFQIFAESFENVAFMGVESYCLTMDLCPSGITAGQDDTPFCPTTGVTS